MDFGNIFRKNSGIFLAFILLSLSFLLFYFSNQGQHLAIHFLDVGQGDATLVQTPLGINILIDAGVNRSILAPLADNLSFFDKDIEYIFATHGDADHIGGIPFLLDRYTVGTIFMNIPDEPSALESTILEKAGRLDISVIPLRSGDVLLIDGMKINVLWPPDGFQSDDRNENSFILMLEYRGEKILLTGDASKFVESRLVNVFSDSLDAAILKAGHHGSRTSSFPNFLSHVQPDIAIISASCDNRYGHPHQSVLATLVGAGAEVFETCHEGTITTIFDVTTNSFVISD